MPPCATPAALIFDVPDVDVICIAPGRFNRQLSFYDLIDKNEEETF